MALSESGGDPAGLGFRTPLVAASDAPSPATTLCARFGIGSDNCSSGLDWTAMPLVARPEAEASCVISTVGLPSGLWRNAGPIHYDWPVSRIGNGGPRLLLKSTMLAGLVRQPLPRAEIGQRGWSGTRPGRLWRQKKARSCEVSHSGAALAGCIALHEQPLNVIYIGDRHESR